MQQQQLQQIQMQQMQQQHATQAMQQATASQVRKAASHRPADAATGIPPTHNRTQVQKQDAVAAAVHSACIRVSMVATHLYSTEIALCGQQGGYSSPYMGVSPTASAGFRRGGHFASTSFRGGAHMSPLISQCLKSEVMPTSHLIRCLLFPRRQSSTRSSSAPVCTCLHQPSRLLSSQFGCGISHGSLSHRLLLRGCAPTLLYVKESV